MAIKRNETLGNITKFIMALRDERILNENILNGMLKDYETSLTTLKDNRNFVEGVWSGFVWDQGIEGFFWRQIITHKKIEVLRVEEKATQLEIHQG